MKNINYGKTRYNERNKTNKEVNTSTINGENDVTHTNFSVTLMNPLTLTYICLSYVSGFT